MIEKPILTPAEAAAKVREGDTLMVGGFLACGSPHTLIQALKEKGNYVVTVVEGRGPAFIFWVDRLKEYSDEVHVVAGCGKTAWANEFIEQELASGETLP